MAAQQNPLDGIADELFGWMDSEVSYYADALRGGPNGRAPFSAEVSESQKHDYFTRQMFMTGPDGRVDYSQPNSQGRTKLMQEMGPQKYGEVYSQVAPKQGRRPTLQPEPDGIEE